MAQYPTANLFTFTDESGNIQLAYYPHAPGPLIAGQPSGGPRLEYQGPEGSFVFPDATGPGREHINVEQTSPLGPLVSVVLVPTIDSIAVTLTLLLPPINLAGQDAQDFETIAIKTTSGRQTFLVTGDTKYFGAGGEACANGISDDRLAVGNEVRIVPELSGKTAKEVHLSSGKRAGKDKNRGG